MNELIKYFESLEARIATLEARVAQLDKGQQTIANGFQELSVHSQQMGEHILVIKNLLQEAQEKGELVIEPEVSEPVAEPEIPEPIIEPEPEPIAEPEPVVEPEPEIEVIEEPKVEEEVASPKAAIYGKAVNDIRQAISLGDRFLYQRELFGQNAELMQRTLNELNELNSFDEAMLYISERFKWDTESNTYQQFVVTLHRRFG